MYESRNVEKCCFSMAFTNVTLVLKTDRSRSFNYVDCQRFRFTRSTNCVKTALFLHVQCGLYSNDKFYILSAISLKKGKQQIIIYLKKSCFSEGAIVSSHVFDQLNARILEHQQNRKRSKMCAFSMAAYNHPLFSVFMKNLNISDH